MPLHIRKIVGFCGFIALLGGLCGPAQSQPAPGRETPSNAAPTYRLPPLPSSIGEGNAAAGTAPARGDPAQQMSAAQTAAPSPGTAPSAATPAGQLPINYPSNQNPAPDLNVAPNGPSAAPAQNIAPNGTSAAPAQNIAPNGLPFDFPPPVIPVATPAAESAADSSQLMLSPVVDENITLSNMGQPKGLTLSGGQLQSGITFTLPRDQVVTAARLNLQLEVSPELAARDTSLRLILNGQDLGTVALNQGAGAENSYELEVPAAMVVSNNNLSFSVIDENALQCERDASNKYWVNIHPASHMQVTSQLLDIGQDLAAFPRPFFDKLNMKDASVAFVFSQAVKPEAVEAASLVASHFGKLASYRSIDFPVFINELPLQNGIIFGSPGEQLGGITLPQVEGPALQMMVNPQNPIYKLLLVIGRNEAELRQAAYRLVSSPLPDRQSSLQVPKQDIGLRQPYDAPNWIDTTKPVTLKQLADDMDTLISNGIYHDGIRVGFRAAPDLFMWDGDHIPVHIEYRFPTETWIDEDNSQLNIALNGTFLQNMPVNKHGLLETVWRQLGGDTRQESYTLQLQPYLIYGDNQMEFYFSLKAKPDAPCNLLTSNNIKSRIDPDSYIDLSGTHHFSLLPNLSYYVGASFPFSRMADFSQTVMVLPPKPDAAEISTLLSMAARAGSATGVTLNHVRVLFGLPGTQSARPALAEKDLLVVSSLKNSQFVQDLLADSPYEIRNNLLTIKPEKLRDQLKGYLSGRFFRQGVEADRYLASTSVWRGFLSYQSPWASKRVVVLATATESNELAKLNVDLRSAAINAGIRGDIAVINSENGVRSFTVGSQFPSGEMPWYMMIIWYANQHIIVLSITGLFFAVIIGSCVYVLLARHAAGRLANSANK